MPMSTEYRLGAEECLWLANQTEQLYAKEILLEMARSFSRWRNTWNAARTVLAAGK
jgi:hypothetical protein